ncbi:MAG: winged helix DNA-binding domain-containing protein [Actinomycetota bacterium]|nr:winged helix DNA-binding domain-containing protein [Actinomycetota bacterium]
MTWQQVVSWRVARQLLHDPAGSVVEGARRLAGIQAQVMSSAELAIVVRTGLGPELVRDALWSDRTLVKTWAMRGTLHLLAADELPTWVTALRLEEQTDRRGAAWERYHGVTVDQLETITAAVGELLGASPLTREELGVAVADATGDASYAEVVRTSFGGTILKTAAANGELCFGPNRGQNVTFVAPKQWLPGPWREPDADTATRFVVSRFLDAYGPATDRDFARWWGVPPSDGKKLLRPLRDELVEVDVDDVVSLLTPAGADGLPPRSRYSATSACSPPSIPTSSRPTATAGTPGRPACTRTFPGQPDGSPRPCSSTGASSGCGGNNGAAVRSRSRSSRSPRSPRRSGTKRRHRRAATRSSGARPSRCRGWSACPGPPLPRTTERREGQHHPGYGISGPNEGLHLDLTRRQDRHPHPPPE